jgi:hypothetical protein
MPTRKATPSKNEQENADARRDFVTTTAAKFPASFITNVCCLFTPSAKASPSAVA